MNLNHKAPLFGGKFLGLQFGQIRLFLLAFLASSILMGAHYSLPEGQLIFNLDQFNHLKLSGSVALGLEKGQWIIRTAEQISENAGLPIHQFYSPGAHTFIAIVAILTHDLFLGFSLALILMSTLAFIFSFKLVRYLTQSDIAAMVAAFVFITGPYLAVDRVMRGAIPEYMAICVLPMVLYYQLRAAASEKFGYIIKAVLATAWLFLLHLITAVFFYFFYGVFLLSFFVHNLFICGKNRKYFLIKCFRKIITVAAIIVLIGMLDMYHLFPAMFYKDIIAKTSDVANNSLFNSSRFTPFLAVFSIRELIWPRQGIGITPAACYQLGLMLLAGFVAYIYFKIRDYRSAFAWPLIFTGGLIVYVILLPVIFVGPLKIFDFAQFSYRFLAFFQLLAMILGSLALVAFWQANPDYRPAQKKNLALVLILASIILVSPYLFPKSVRMGYPKYIHAAQVLEAKTLENGNDSYLRTPPEVMEGAKNVPAFEASEIMPATEVRNTADRIFEIELANNKFNMGQYGELFLDVLYYPKLMDIQSTIDGKKFEPILETYWRSREGFGKVGQVGYFHGLKLSGLPAAGKLTVQVKFVGSKAGNWISLATLIVLLGYAVIAKSPLGGQQKLGFLKSLRAAQRRLFLLS
ncbi:MAG: hypothetical protein LBT47_06370 [Deltaproteobacteria bacterium]|jgi:hypothetical protein|nr:hypothetical protein [Deltaproteobacteria bacterium]